MRDNRDIIQQINEYKRRFWLQKLAKGLFVFAGAGIIFFILVAMIEYVSWLNQGQRAALFLITLGIEVFLLSAYILYPLYQLLFGSRALTDEQAAKHIGEVYSNVGDKLLNYLQLRDNSERNELIDAGLAQKSTFLSAFNFKEAVSWRGLRVYSLFLFPVALAVVFLVFGNGWNKVLVGTERLMFFNKQFEKEMPFLISILSEMQVNEGEDYEMKVQLDGDVLPEKLMLQTNREMIALVREGGNMYRASIINCLNNLSFRFLYDDITSETYELRVIKKPLLGKVIYTVTPPPYTGIAPYVVENSTLVEVPQYSQIRMNFHFRNTDSLLVFRESKGSDTSIIASQKDVYAFQASSTSTLRMFTKNTILGESKVNIIADNRPLVNAQLDSTTAGVSLQIQASDDYGITKARIIFTNKQGVEEEISLPHQGVLLKTTIELTFELINNTQDAWIEVNDNIGTTRTKVPLDQFKKKEKTEEVLLNEAGASLKDLAKDKNAPKSKPTNSKSQERKEKAEKINKQAKELAEKDTVAYKRFEELSEKLLKLAEKLEKKLPVNQEKLTEEKFKEMLEQMEKEWALLKTMEKLEAIEKHLEDKNKAVDEKLMNELIDDAKELKDMFKEEGKEEKVDWEEFDNLKEDNEELKNQEETTDDDGNKKDQPKDKKKSKDDLVKDMKKSSKKLREQLGDLSDMLNMEQSQENIELLRRLEIRALKTSVKQEEVYRITGQKEVDKGVYVSQKEISTSATGILDSLSVLTVSDPQLAQVLLDFEKNLSQHLTEIKSLNEENPTSFRSAQRYLQYGLNDLAAVLYDILKSEKDNMQSMSGNKECNNPKPGKGKKGKMSKQQKMLGDKMKDGEGEGEGEGKKGEAGKGQTIGQKELLEIIKGQEDILSDFQKEHGNKPGAKDIIDEMNRQIDDLIQQNIDRALMRNKNIEEKLLVFEESINKKEDIEEKRQSKENTLSYEDIRNSVLHDYLKGRQQTQGVVNLPALKNYYSGKWIQVNQK